MKTRKGFVSNSSTSSFIVVGVYTDQKTAEAKATNDVTYYEGREDGLGDNEHFLGVTLASWCGDASGSKELSLKEINQAVEQVKEAVGDATEDQITILCGTRMC